MTKLMHMPRRERAAFIQSQLERLTASPDAAPEVTARREREDKLKRHDERWGLDGFGSALPRYVSAGDPDGGDD